MQYDEFVDQVQESAGLASRGAAERVTRATLGTLGERLYRTQRDNLAAMLPDELKEALAGEVEARATRGDVDRFPLDNFYVRVAGRAEISRTEAIDQSRAVMSVLREAITPSKWEDVRSSLPDEYDLLFGQGLEGVSPTRSDSTFEVSMGES